MKSETSEAKALCNAKALLRAVKLADGQRLAEALGDAQAALTYDPNSTEAIILREKLEVMMQELRVNVSDGITGCRELGATNGRSSKDRFAFKPVSRLPSWSPRIVPPP